MAAFFERVARPIGGEATPAPATTILVVAGLADPALLVEIQAVAVAQS